MKMQIIVALTDYSENSSHILKQWGFKDLREVN